MTHPIPAAALSQHIAILGKTGSGKTYAAKGVVENILREGGRVCVIDPTGAWHGLRSSATGKSAGFPVVIFGGANADLPLGAAYGEALAEIIGTSSTPAIIDTSLMRVGERTRFFADFADAMVRKNKGPLHLVIDEAHLFAPQGKVNDPQSGAMLHAANNLVSLGRSRGLRIILITQRPAKLHKDSLTQVETLVALRLIAPQDRKAVEEWIKDNADEKKGREIIESLATLPTGQGWVWAPEIKLLERVTFPKIKTFDTSRAPDADEAGAGVVLAPIDRSAIEQRLQVVAADALANDPKALKAEVAKLRRELAAKPVTQIPTADPQAVEGAYQNGLAEGLAHGENRAKAALAAVESRLKDALAVAGASIESLDSPMPAPLPRRQVTAPPVQAANGHARPMSAAGDGSISPTARKILDEIHRANPVALSFEAAALRAAVSRRSSAYGLYRKQVEASGEVERRSDGRLHSAPGFAAPVHAGADPVEAFATRLPPSYAGMLRVIAGARGPMTKEEIADAANVSPTSSGLTGGLRELMALSLVEKDGDAYSIHSDLQ